MSSTPVLQPVRAKQRRSLTPLRIILGVLLIGVLAVAGISGYVCYSLTHPVKKPLATTPASLDIPYQDIEFRSIDGFPLRGWFLPAATGSNDKLVIMAHGYKGNRVGDKPALPTAQALVSGGISVLLFDFRNSGESDGSMTTVGALEKSDLLQAVKFAQDQGYGKEGIGFLGFSMGASTALAAAAEESDVKALVVDSPFADLNDYLHENLKYWTHLPDIPFTQVILWEIPLITGHQTSEVSPIRTVDKLRNRPILFIHGGSDQAIDKSNSEHIYAALNALNARHDELWSVAGADHVGTYELDPLAYTKRVVEFFQKSL